MASRPDLIVFDVNETLSDMSPMADRFTDVGAPAPLARAWFAGVLRDGFALTVVGSPARFADLAADGLRAVLAGVPLDRDVDAAVEHVMSGFAELPVHPDVVPGVEALSRLGIRLVTLSNGSTSVAERLLERAGVLDRFEALLSVEASGAWKPAGAAYADALARCGVEPADAMLVAVHPWDIDGARRAGLATAWVDRRGGPYPEAFGRADHDVGSVEELAQRLR